jgi:hypothetical protein
VGIDQIPAVVTAAAEALYAELAKEDASSEARELLSRLVTDPRMKVVWRELYRKNRKRPGEFMHPAYVTHTAHARLARQRAAELRKMHGENAQREVESLEKEAAFLETLEGPFFPTRSEQDEGVRLFFFHAFHNAVDIKPEFASEAAACAKKLETVATELRHSADVLESLGKKREAKKLRSLAEDCEDEAFAREPTPDDLGVILRKSDVDPKIRTFISAQATIAMTVFAKPLYGTLSTVTNVVFPGAKIAAPKVREMLRI